MENKDNEEEKKDKRAAFHGGFAYLERIADLLGKLNDVRIPYLTEEKTLGGLSMQQHRQRLSLLKGLLQELFSQIKDEPKERKTQSANQECAEYLYDFSNDQIKKGKLDIDVRFIRAFDEWEKQLRDIVDRKGLLMPKKRDGSDAAGE